MLFTGRDVQLELGEALHCPWRQDKVSAVQLREKLLQPIMTMGVLHWQKLLCNLGHPNCMKRLSTEGRQEG